jgi:uncharacterized membrane protein
MENGINYPKTDFFSFGTEFFWLKGLSRYMTGIFNYQRIKSENSKEIALYKRTIVKLGYYY